MNLGRRSHRVSLLLLSAGVALAAVWSPTPAPAQAVEEQPAPARIVAWNDLGMHCIDPDFSVFSILPPFNTLNAQLIVGEQLITSGLSYEVTYEAEPDGSGSINTTSIGKTNFWEHAQALFGVTLPPDVGLAGYAMPGAGNVPQDAHFDGAWDWFQAEGIPVTPFDDALAKQPYPLYRIAARDSNGQVVASTVTTAPNSQELECSLCHASGSSPFARPAAGWVYDQNPLEDDRLNILRLHDELQLGDPTYDAALVTAGLDPAGLFATATGGQAVLCDSCHASNALPGTGIAGVSSMTSAVHGLHANQLNELGEPLDAIGDRTSCYVCHPGFDTQCLRGAMGKAVGADGDFSMSCQSCHDSMAAVGDPDRVGWFEQPSCQNCHTGSATNNNGEIRFDSAFDASGELRAPVSQLFATTPDVPLPGYDLYRFSSGHGGLQCAACHGPPHAIYPTSEPNDNLQNELIQGHGGTLVDCAACHDKLEDDELYGAHGMHAVDSNWVNDDHGDEAEHNGLASCQACHGIDSKGTELSYALGDRTISTKYGTRSFFRGARVGCYHCHDGPSDENPVTNLEPTVPDLALATASDVDLPIALAGSDPEGQPLSFRIIEQPLHGKVAFDGQVATYRAEAGYVGADAFTYAAHDGLTNSNLGTIDVNVTSAACGSFETYGFGCPGTGGHLPTLTVEGCATPGGTLTLTVEGGLAGAKVLFLRGNQQALRELQPGCVLRVAPLKIMGSTFLAGGGPGDGSASFTHQLPQGPGVQTRTFQAFIRDKGTGLRGVFTNAVQVDW